MSTLTAPPTPAGAVVSNIPELLESILSFVQDPYTILLSQRTNKALQATIIGSPSLQRTITIAAPVRVRGPTASAKRIYNELNTNLALKFFSGGPKPKTMTARIFMAGVDVIIPCPGPEPDQKFYEMWRSMKLFGREGWNDGRRMEFVWYINGGIGYEDAIVSMKNPTLGDTYDEVYGEKV